MFYPQIHKTNLEIELIAELDNFCSLKQLGLLPILLQVHRRTLRLWLIMGPFQYLWSSLLPQVMMFVSRYLSRIHLFMSYCFFFFYFYLFVAIPLFVYFLIVDAWMLTLLLACEDQYKSFIICRLCGHWVMLLVIPPDAVTLYLPMEPYYHCWHNWMSMPSFLCWEMLPGRSLISVGASHSHLLIRYIFYWSSN